MKKDTLEKFIIANKEEFDVYSPDEKLWNNIRNKNTKKTRIIPLWLKTAYRISAVIIIFIASYVFHEYRELKSHERAFASHEEELYQLIPELKETESFYNNKVNLKMDELQPFLKNLPGLKSELQYDMNELDSVYSSLKKDLKENISNDQVLEAMIDNYRLKIEILEDLLKEANKEKTISKNETNKYHI